VSGLIINPHVLAAPAPSGHRYWRLLITANNGDTFRVGTLEVILATAPGGATVASGGTASASSENVAGDAAKAFDGDTTSSGWISANLSTLGGLHAGNPQWLRYDFGAGNEKNIVEFGVGSYPASSSVNARSLADFKLQYSDDGSAWTDAKSVTGQSGWAFQEVRRFSIP
jgi:hypothetical protein